MNPNNMTPEEQAAFEASLKEEHNMVFTKGELLIIFNILTRISLPYSELKVAPLISGLVDKINAVVAVDSNIPKKDDIISSGKKAN